MGIASLNIGRGYLYVPAIPAYDFGISDFTVEAWVRTISGGTIVGKKVSAGGPGNGGFLLVARPDGTIKFATDNGAGFFEVVSAGTSVCDGIWHHVAAVRQGAAIALYLDGQPLSVTPRGNATPPLDVSSGCRLTIGTVDQEQEPFRTLIGAVAELRLWSQARSADDIAGGYSSRLPPGTTGLAGYWSAEQGLVADFSGNNNAAQVSGEVIGSTDAPAVGPSNAPTMLFLFAGVYDCAVKWGGASGTWNPSSQLHLTSMGFVVLDNQVMSNVVITGNGLQWPSAGNPCSGSVMFGLNSSDPYFWPNGQTRFNFTGSTQSGSAGAVDYRGVVRPTRVGCGAFLSIGAGQIFHTDNPVAGSPVTLAPKTPQISQHYCQYDNQQILEMVTGLALSAQGGLVPGARIVLAISDPSISAQQWVLGGDGTITAAGAPGLAIAVDASVSPRQLVLATLNASDLNQQFVTLSAPQFVFNADPSLVIAGSAGGQVTVQAKADDAPYELWCVSKSSLLSAATAQALAVSGVAAPGATLALATYNPADAAQGFAFDQGRLVHRSSGLPIKMSAASAGLTLGEAGEAGANLTWTLAATAPAASSDGPHLARRSAQLQAEVPGSIDYIVEIWTSDAWFAGTDDKVEVSLVGDWKTSIYVELKNSLSHTNPFERGSIDRFKVTLPNLGKIKAINVRFGANNWFFTDDWGLDKIYVYDPVSITRYGTGYLGNGSTFWVPSTTQIKFNSAYVIGSIDSTMVIGKAPSQDATTRGWVDHTWAKVESQEDPKTTYFDCGGSNNGPGAVPSILSSKCSLNTAVKMATGYPIEPSHPYQAVYGHDDVNGKETCGIRASGFRGWDGQCHQMVNRLLYTCNPPISLDDCPDALKPNGYGLSVMMWGKYGVQFDQWCRLSGFPAPPARNSSLFDYVRRYISNPDQQIEVAYAAIAMQGATGSDPQSIHGPAAHTFFQQAQRYGISNATMSRLTCLPEDKVIEEQQP